MHSLFILFLEHTHTHARKMMSRKRAHPGSEEEEEEEKEEKEREEKEDDNARPIGFPAAAQPERQEMDFSGVRIEPMSQFMRMFPHTDSDPACRLAIFKTHQAEAELRLQKERDKFAGALAAADGTTSARSKKKRRMNDPILAGAAAASALFDAADASAALADPKGYAKHVGTLPSDNKDLTLVQLRELHYEQSQARPIALELLCDARRMLFKPEYHFPDRIPSDDEAYRLLRAKTRVSLPILTAQAEQQMMIQAGTWWFGNVQRTLPPCLYGVNCIGNHGMIQGLTEPVTFMAAMTEPQWRRLQETGEAPGSRWPCVLCHRYHSHEYVRQARVSVGPGHEIRASNPNEVLQFWYVLVDRPGGYKREFTEPVLDHEILIAPLAVIHYDLMPAQRAHPRAPWYVTQTQMMYDTGIRERQVPRLGETVKDFCSGAGRSNTDCSPTAPGSHAETRPCPASTACSDSASAAFPRTTSR